MDDDLKSIAILLIGWLLGTLSPAIVERIRSKRDAGLGRTAVDNELAEFSSVLLAACLRIRGSSGEIDRPFLEWLKVNFEKIEGNEQSAKFLLVTNTLLAYPDDDIVGAAKLMALADGRAGILQKYPVPLLDFRISSLQIFSTDVQVKLLQIRRNVSLLDAIVEQSREFYRMTFTQLADGNHELVRGNLKQSYGEYAARARIIIEQINQLRALR